MLNKLGGLARALYILLAIVGGFVAIGGVNVALLLLLLGLVSGISMPRERLTLAMIAVVALPMIGAALATIPAIGTQLGAIMANLQVGVAGAAAMALAILLYELVMEGVMGMTGSGSGSSKAATA